MKTLIQHINEKLIINKDFKRAENTEDIAKYLIKMLNITYHNTPLLDDTPITDWVIEYIVDILNKEGITYVSKYEFYTREKSYSRLPADLKKSYKVVKWKSDIFYLKKICTFNDYWALHYRYDMVRKCYEIAYFIERSGSSGDFRDIYTCLLYV